MCGGAWQRVLEGLCRRRVRAANVDPDTLRPSPSTPLHPQMALVSALRIALRETDARAFFFAVKAITDEKQRCERVLGLLLPPTLVTSSRS